MKKFFIGLAIGIATAVTLFFLLAEHQSSAEEATLKDLPKEIGIGTEEYFKRVAAKRAELQKATAAEIAAKFNKAFGG
jgi:hypothetical protein